MIFEVSVFLGILRILGIYRSAVAVEFYRAFRIFKHKFYRTAGLGLLCIRASPYAPDKFYFAKIVLTI